MTQLRVCSYGGGVQSTALLVLAAQGTIDFPTFLFANVGDDSEHPATLRYVREIALPYARDHGIDLHELRRHKRDGSVETLLGRMQANNGGAVVIPFKLSADGPPGRRGCTADFKVRVLSKWMRHHGATRQQPAVVALGISVDEIHRARTAGGEPLQAVVYPLLDLRLDRSACAAIILAAGLAVPSKSSCYFCPFKTNQRWQTMRQDEPELFEKAVELEAMVNAKRDALGLSRVFLHNRRVPLPMATTANHQHNLFEDSGLDVCESGYCMV